MCYHGDDYLSTPREDKIFVAFETSCVTTATNMEMGQVFGTREGEFSVGCEVGGGYLGK